MALMKPNPDYTSNHKRRDMILYLCKQAGTRTILACVIALFTGACQVTPPDVSAEIDAATGIKNAIVFDQASARVPAGPGTPFTLDQAIRLTLEHDYRIQSALARVRIAEADANQARLLPNPILSVDLRYPQEAGTNTVFEATLTGDLLSLLQKPGQIAAADKRLRKSALEAVVVALDVMAEIQQAYLAAQLVDAQIENAVARAKINQQLRGIAQKRFDLGEGTKLDLLTLDSQVIQADLDLADLQLERTADRLALAKLIGQPRSSLDWSFPTDMPPVIAPGEEAAWIDAALQHRPELQARVWELGALGDDLSAAEFSPFVGGDVGAHAERDPEWRAGPAITVPLPVFDWGQAAHAKLEAQRMEVRNELAGQEEEIIQDVRLSYATLVQSLQALSNARDKLLPVQSQQLDQAQLSYKAGDADLTTLLLAQTNLVLTQNRLFELQEKVAVAHIKLQRAAGGAVVAAELESLVMPQPAVTQPTSVVPTSRPATGP